MEYRCFLVTPTQFVERSLRRYHTYSAATPVDGQHSYHNAKRFLDIVAEHTDTEVGDIPTLAQRTTLDFPIKCESCDYLFTDTDAWQIFTSRLWEGVDPNGVKVTASLRDMPIGAMWDAYWCGDCWKGLDGKSYTVKIPPDGHDWSIDAVASNCDAHDDREHRCWIRHGVAPNLTVDKDCSSDASAVRTCKAGAGSIQTPQWHGFLTKGVLVPC